MSASSGSGASPPSSPHDGPNRGETSTKSIDKYKTKKIFQNNYQRSHKLPRAIYAKPRDAQVTVSSKTADAAGATVTDKAIEAVDAVDHAVEASIHLHPTGDSPQQQDPSISEGVAADTLPIPLPSSTSESDSETGPDNSDGYCSDFTIKSESDNDSESDAENKDDLSHQRHRILMGRGH